MARHPNSGKQFRINIDNGMSQAGYDQMLHGILFQLIDWAQNMAQDSSISAREKEVALMFYAHRCLPDLPVTDPIPPDAIPLEGLVYGTYKIENPAYEPARGKTYLAVLREEDLVYVDQ